MSLIFAAVKTTTKNSEHFFRIINQFKFYGFKSLKSKYFPQGIFRKFQSFCYPY
jgi:hypothetical protein